MLALVGRDGLLHAARIGRLYVAGVGKALGVGLAVAAAVGGGLTASVLPAGVGVPAAHGVAALSLLARARTTAERVRLRLRLFAVSAAAGGLHHFVVSQPSSATGHSAGVLRSMVQGLGAAGIAVCLGLGVAGLVMAAVSIPWKRRGFGYAARSS